MSEWKAEPFKAILAAKEEDRFTVYLAELLQSPAVRRRFLNDVCGEESHEPLSVRTQVTVTGYGRPDLIIQADGRNYQLVFEAKVGSWTHESQLPHYHNYLEKWKAENSGEGKLFLLAPSDTAEQIVSCESSELKKEIKPITWQKVADVFQDVAKGIENSRLKYHLKEFADLVHYRMGKDRTPFTAEEQLLLEDRLAGETILKCRDLVDNVLVNLRKRNPSINIGVMKGANFYVGTGLTIEYGHHWWFGIWMDAWSKIGISPIVLQLCAFDGHQGATSLPKSLEDIHEWCSDVRRFDEGGISPRHVIPFKIRPDVEFEELSGKFAEILERIIKEWPESGS